MIDDAFDKKLVSDLKFDLDKAVKEQLTDVEITQDFIDYRDELTPKYQAYGRDSEQMARSGDALLAEYILPQTVADIQPATHFGHDIILHGAKIDLKVVREKWFTVENDKDRWYNQCIHGGELHHFAFLQYTKSQSKPFVAGDRTSLRLINLVPAARVMYNLRRSRYNGYYYKI